MIIIVYFPPAAGSPKVDRDIQTVELAWWQLDATQGHQLGPGMGLTQAAALHLSPRIGGLIINEDSVASADADYSERVSI